MKIDEFIERNNRLGIKKYYPGERCSIYLICDKEGKIIYIGSTKNIDSRLSTHEKREDFNETIKYYFEYPKDKYLNKEKELIRRIRPKLNISGKKIKKKSKWHRLCLNMKIIKSKMEKLNWGIPRLAKEMNTAKDSIQYTFSCERCGPKTVDNIARALEIEPKDLII